VTDRGVDEPLGKLLFEAFEYPDGTPEIVRTGFRADAADGPDLVQ
jgi:hypothetical protein